MYAWNSEHMLLASVTYGVPCHTVPRALESFRIFAMEGGRSEGRVLKGRLNEQ
jgi:hypothetical protein